jgi:hypothetical protein
MTELKFTCPSCGQHIQCSPECANQNVPCPACATLIRVPADAELTDSPGALTEDNPFQSPEKPKVSYADAEEHSPAHKDAAPASPPAARVDNKPLSAVREELEVARPIAQSSELQCVCPVCRSELRISVTAKSQAVSRTGDKLSHSAAFQSASEHLSAAEREKKIAAAREANPVKSVVKPRLDKILSEEFTKVEFVPPQQPNSAEAYQPEIDPAQILRSHNSE